MKSFTRFKNFSWLIFSLFILLQNCSTQKDQESMTENSEPEYYTVADFASVEKFDTHVHLNTLDTAFINQAAEDNMRFLDIVDDRPFGITLEDQQKIAVQQVKAFPDRISYATTFPVKNWNEDGWQEETIDYLKNSISNGAIAVKVWKNIGMALKDKEGNFVMIDHPKFDPIFDFLEKKNITLVGHLGEPKDCWSPLEEMTMKGNRGYYSSHPEYHMYLHPEYPSYEDQINARDSMLVKHPNLLFIGAHLGSLEWSLDEVAKRLDRFPNMAVDLARMSNLQYHAMNHWQKTHDFFVKYQDRLVYATDRAVNTTKNPEEMKQRVHEGRIRDWTFFTTDEKMNSSGFEGEFKGLKLPKEVVDKIFLKNAERWLLGASLEI